MSQDYAASMFSLGNVHSNCVPKMATFEPFSVRGPSLFWQLELDFVNVVEHWLTTQANLAFGDSTENKSL